MLRLNWKKLYHMNIFFKLMYVLLISCLVIVYPTSAHQSEKEKLNGMKGTEGNFHLSTPEECARQCGENETAKICYYRFTVELYTVLGGACKLCNPVNDSLTNDCQCVLADGVIRGILTVNRMLPGPSIQVCLNDKVVIDVENKMQGMELTIHWHGILQKESPYYDGVPFITQCPINEGNTFRYQWIADNAGTHYWHAHTGIQKMDGIYGNLIVRTPPSKDPNYQHYDYDLSEHIMLISDWMHEGANEHFPGLMNEKRGQDAASALINGKGRYKDPNTGNVTDTPLEIFTIDSGKKYRFRMINAFCTVCPAELTIQGHSLTVIATDGQPVKPKVVNSIISFSGERYDFIIHANRSRSAYWIQLRALGECRITRVQQLGVLRYKGAGNKPCSREPTYDNGLPKGVVLNPLDAICNKSRSNAVCVSQLDSAKPVDEGLLKDKPDVKVWLPYHFYFYQEEEVYEPNSYKKFLLPETLAPLTVLIDNISHVPPTSPMLSQRKDIPEEQLCNGKKRPKNCEEPCECTHVIDIELNKIVELIIMDTIGQADLYHPFHLHGYDFNVLEMGQFSDSKNVTKLTMERVKELDNGQLLHRKFNLPPGKDTIVVPMNGYVIVRFRADNPGYWLLHCHFIYHGIIGMEVVLHVGDDSDLPPVPSGFPVCGDYSPKIEPP